MENSLTKIEEKQLATVLKTAEELHVNTYEQVMDAADVLFAVKRIGEIITERKEEITRPMNEALKSARSFFKPFEAQYAEAESIVKNKILDWHQAHWAEETRQDNTIAGSKGKVTVVERFTLEIEDETKIPRELCSPDLERVKHALEAGLKVKGAKLIPVYSIMAAKL